MTSERDKEAAEEWANPRRLDRAEVEMSVSQELSTRYEAFLAGAKYKEASAEKLVEALERIMEPYDSEWSREEMITALRHDEHEARSALAEYRGK